MRYFCVQDCFTNKQYFVGGRFYEGYDVERGLEPEDKPGDLKHFVQVSPRLEQPRKPRELKEGQIPTAKQVEDQVRWEKDYSLWEEKRKLIDMAAHDANAELRELKALQRKGTVRGLGARVETLEGRLRELRAA